MSKKLMAASAAVLFSLAGLVGAVTGRLGAGAEVRVVPAEDVTQLRKDVADIRERMARIEGWLQGRVNEGRR